MITIIYDTPVDPRFPLHRTELRHVLAALCRAMDMTDAAFILRLVDDAQMAVLNNRFLGCSGPTNILSFPAQDEENARDSDGDGSLGELALSVPTLVREAELYGQTALEHTARLLSHGILHLMGHEHGPEMDMLNELAVEAAAKALAS